MTLHHTSFVLQRALPGSPKHAFRFWSDFALKRRWTGCHPDWTVLEDRMDFREGGGETTRWIMPDGTAQDMVAHYLEIVPAERIVYAYTMRVSGEPVSSSLVSVEFSAEGAETRMQWTEQAAFRDAAVAEQRANGTGSTFDSLVAVMQQALATAH